MAPNELAEWYWNVPRLSRYWFTGSVVLPLLGRIGLLSPYSMILVWEKLAYSFHIWRPITALLYYPISPQTGFHYLINLYFLYSYSTALESGQFAGNPAEYAFLLLFCWICLVALGCAVGLYLLMDPMVLAVLYIWCQLNRDTIVQFWFGMQFKAMYLPWVLLAFNMIIQGGGFTELLGILVGHLYFFLAFKYPQDLGGRQLIGAPEFLYRLLPRQRGGVSGFGVPPSNRRREDGTDGAGDDERRGGWFQNRFPGAGHRLGQD
ncbi:hypothetical protein BOX15_Mlig003689g1 [Macrostomum lignano]|uniref:Derlin n=1 Tax=Macrostomum lignano TaxID=282301 RepID=A0A267FI24_9PLAT|nr:hypothetical protein BOX15_Mlig010137g1 [Macrostomum lignano]PAA83333.1 hypothetical protein BOX15_Mlig003689g1 [Macrostomum lignano]